ncbi:WcaG Nucleoside-diphosphate-sugar epimerases [Candidatus Nanopelagicaceae bacterium]
MYVSSEKVYIPGHSGLLGKSVQKIFSEHGFDLELRNSWELDLRNADQVFEFISKTKPDGIVLCAAYVGGIGENSDNPLEMHHRNSLIQYSILNAAHLLKIPKLIFVSSAAIYPAANPLNREDDIWTGAPSKEHIQYASAKLSGMEFVKWAREKYSLNWISVIPTNIYGSNERWDITRSHVIAALIMKFVSAESTKLSEVEIWGSGDSRREFMHADDAATALVQAYVAIENANFDRFNLGAEVDISVRELAIKIANLCGYSGELIFNPSKPEGPKLRKLDMSRTSRFIDWKPRIELEDGIEKAILAYRESIGMPS